MSYRVIKEELHPPPINFFSCLTEAGLSSIQILTHQPSRSIIVLGKSSSLQPLLRSLTAIFSCDVIGKLSVHLGLVQPPNDGPLGLPRCCFSEWDDFSVPSVWPYPRRHWGH